jgi:elongation factor P
MALIGANELKKKLLIEFERQPYTVLEVFFATPTARGASTMVRTRLKNLLNGSVLEKTFRTSEKFPEPDVEIASASFLYRDSGGFHFMDSATYEQFTLSEDSVGGDQWFLKEGVTWRCFNREEKEHSMDRVRFGVWQVDR